MCFSAAGSFTVSAVLIGLGAGAVAQSRGAARWLAVVPLFFGLQQMAEGVVWRTMGDDAGGLVHAASVVAFLAFALVVWPTWMPLAMARIERDRARRRMLRWFVVAGGVVSAAGLAAMIAFHPHAVMAGHSIDYDFGVYESPWLQVAVLLVYMAPAVTPFLLSTFPLARPIGALLLVALFVTVIVEERALTSVWCFFAAIVSTLILVAVRRERDATVPLLAA